jgi:hypothetical protein
LPETGSGKTAWIFKNSHGTSSGTKGYTTIVKLLSDFSITAFKLPPTSKIYKVDTIRCVDLDKDGYFFWGMGPKSATCPQGCSDEEDCDDSRNDLGPMMADGSCKKITSSLNPYTVQSPQQLNNHCLNRFTRFVTIEYLVPHNSRATVKIFDLAGNVIRVLIRNNREKGWQKVMWDGTNESGGLICNGVYICTVETDKTHAKSHDSFKVIVAR